MNDLGNSTFFIFNQTGNIGTSGIHVFHFGKNLLPLSESFIIHNVPVDKGGLLSEQDCIPVGYAPSPLYCKAGLCPLEGWSLSGGSLLGRPPPLCEQND